MGGSVAGLWWKNRRGTRDGQKPLAASSKGSRWSLSRNSPEASGGAAGLIG